jgi:hypothetical protein
LHRVLWLVGGEVLLRLVVLTGPGICKVVLTHTRLQLLHVVHLLLLLLLLEEEWIGWLGHVAIALRVLPDTAGLTTTITTTPIVRVTSATAATSLVVLVAGNLTQLGLAMGEGTVCSIRTTLIHFEEFALDSFEIVSETTLSLLLISSIIPVSTAAVLVASFVRLSLLVAVAFITAVASISCILVVVHCRVECILLLLWRWLLLAHVVILRLGLVLHIRLVLQASCV